MAVRDKDSNKTIIASEIKASGIEKSGSEELNMDI
jgi:hypothetical protein